MFIKTSRQMAFTIIEVMIATVLASIVGVIIATFAIFSARSFAAMTNYADMNQDSQLAIDKMSKDIRQTRQLTAVSSNSLTFLDVYGNSLQFVYSPSEGTLSRISSNQTTVLLSNCNSLEFWTYQPVMISNSFDCYTTAAVTNARVIELTWSCSRRILGHTNATTESIQSAEIVMRNH